VDNYSSDSINLNASIVQGSVLDPIMFSIFISDLHPISSTNAFIKYADDITLIFNPSSPISIEDEIDNVSSLASLNKLKLNIAKTKEIIIQRPKIRTILPNLLQDIERVSQIKLLGVTITSNLKWQDHINALLAVCKQRCYILSVLRQYGVCKDRLHTIFNAIIMSKIMYASCAWSGHITQQDADRIKQTNFAG
jgi:hypothetical protein